MNELEITLERLNGEIMTTKLSQHKSAQGIGANKYEYSPNSMLLRELGMKAYQEHSFPVLTHQSNQKHNNMNSNKSAIIHPNGK